MPEFITQRATRLEYIKENSSLMPEKWKIQLNGSHNRSTGVYIQKVTDFN